MALETGDQRSGRVSDATSTGAPKSGITDAASAAYQPGAQAHLAAMNNFRDNAQAKSALPNVDFLSVPASSAGDQGRVPTSVAYAGDAKISSGVSKEGPTESVQYSDGGYTTTRLPNGDLSTRFDSGPIKGGSETYFSKNPDGTDLTITDSRTQDGAGFKKDETDTPTRNLIGYRDKYNRPLESVDTDKTTGKTTTTLPELPAGWKDPGYYLRNLEDYDLHGLQNQG